MANMGITSFTNAVEQFKEKQELLTALRHSLEVAKAQDLSDSMSDDFYYTNGGKERAMQTISKINKSIKETAAELDLIHDEVMRLAD